MTTPAVRDASSAVRWWLFAVAGLVLLMVMVGGATRLTGSGLSITEWQPIMGAVPPLSDAAWVDAFDKYRQIPQYRLVNKGMSLDAFKVIFWWEWGHRLLGRLIGLAFALPLAFFWATGRLSPRLKLPLLGLLMLGGLQGAVGWYMVQSGLSGERIAVSPYRLAFHLTLAIVILGLLVWTALGLAAAKPRIRLAATAPWQTRAAVWLLALLFLQIVVGGFVAGTKAGLTYNTWPLMDGRIIPNGLATLSPWYLNLAENVTTVQFLHRTLAYVLLALAVWHAVWIWRAADDDMQRSSAVLLAVGIWGQAGLGIWTLISVHDGAIPFWLGVLHQGSAALLVAVAVWHLSTMVRTGVSDRRRSI